MSNSATSDDEGEVSLQILFQVPARQHDDDEIPAHERYLEHVPRSVAEQIVDGFTAYTNEPSEANRREAYTYERLSDGVADGEMLLALDFGEIISVKVVPDEDGAQRRGQRLPM